MYTSIVPLTTELDVFLTDSGKPVLKNPESNDSNILKRISLVGCGTQSKLKCRVNLGVKLLLPPPGGAEQIHNIVS